MILSRLAQRPLRNSALGGYHSVSSCLHLVPTLAQLPEGMLGGPVSRDKKRKKKKGALSSVTKGLDTSQHTEGSQVQFLMKGTYLGCRVTPQLRAHEGGNQWI